LLLFIFLLQLLCKSGAGTKHQTLERQISMLKNQGLIERAENHFFFWGFILSVGLCGRDRKDCERL
jgi:hypothetical protein